eukprot:TRINITY_DN93474_c0_g1_i1.p1 TRINITY_DN93474_c0_g1~~TRINITY_DN93474_c0_g1_i1.p1  ORF type:complete len:156 (-),score=33.76 TRINITY_DN93474_c0_g1_i1:36-464(-)
MEEAEALCDRLAIQVKGRLRCLGTPAHLKRIYSSGYQLEVFLNPNGSETRLVAFVQAQLMREAKLREHHGNRYVFELPPPSHGNALSLGRLFSTLEQNKLNEGISDYALTQPLLEQVFLRFAREQELEDEVDQEATGDSDGQ